MRPTMGDIVNYSVPLKPFTIKADAPKAIIKEAKRVNAIRIKCNCQVLYHFEDERLNDDDKLDYSKPILEAL